MQVSVHKDLRATDESPVHCHCSQSADSGKPLTLRAAFTGLEDPTPLSLNLDFSGRYILMLLIEAVANTMLVVLALGFGLRTLNVGLQRLVEYNLGKVAKAEASQFEGQFQRYSEGDNHNY